MLNENPNGLNNLTNTIGSSIRNWIAKTFDPDSLIYKHWAPSHDEHQVCGPQETPANNQEEAHNQPANQPNTENQGNTEAHQESAESEEVRFARYLETIDTLRAQGIPDNSLTFLIGLRAAGFGDFIKDEDVAAFTATNNNNPNLNSEEPEN